MVRREQSARFIEPMECLPGQHIPEGDHWTYELGWLSDRSPENGWQGHALFAPRSLET
jgi:hypothetical protein